MISMGGPEPVVAGVDHSAQNEIVIAYAAWEALRRGRVLRLVHGSSAPAGTKHRSAASGEDPDRSEPSEAWLARVLSETRAAYPELTVESRMIAGSGASALVGESSTADLVIVGARGEGGFADLLLGSVATQVSEYARCPVIVLRGRPTGLVSGPGHGRVLVGVDGSAGSSDVLGFAFDEAAARDVPLIAAHVWSIPEMSARSVGMVWSRDPATARDQLGESARRVLTDELTGWREKYPQVGVKAWTLHGNEPARTLLAIEARLHPALVVVGSHPHPASTAQLGISVSENVVANARASVAVLH